VPELSEPVAGLEPAPDALDAIGSTHEEFENFFGDVFDQLQSLSLELFARHKCLELVGEQKEREQAAEADHQQHFEAVVGELQQLRGAVTRADEFRDEFRRAWAEFHTDQEERRRERTELHGMQEAIEGHLARLAAIAAELADARSPLSPASEAATQQIERVLDDARNQRAAWEQERTALHAELERLRGHAAELSETVAEQRRQAGQQEAALAAELKRMRGLLEAISGRMQGGPFAPAARPAVNDPVLDSVLAQFEILQRDLNTQSSRG
jgi:chromosome segregation ATPase